MPSPSLSEYEAFQRLHDGLEQASSAALELAYFRSDQSREWQKMAELYKSARDMANVLAGGGEVGKNRT